MNRSRAARLLAVVSVGGLILAGSVLAASPASAAPCVSTDAALGAAITAASDGDTIDLCAGAVIQPATNYIVKVDLTIAGDPTDPAHLEKPAADGIPIFQNTVGGKSFEIDNAIVTNPPANLGAAITQDGGDAPLTLKNDSFSGFLSGVTSLLTPTGDVTIAGSTFTNNHNTARAGAVISTSAIDGDLRITGSTFDGNVSSLSGAGTGTGGAIAIDEVDSVTITDSTFTNNRADVHGGAISIGNINASSTWSGDTFSGNAAGSTADGSPPSGGAVYIVRIFSPAAFLLVNSTVTDNHGIQEANLASLGAGFFVDDLRGTVKVEDSTFAGNTFGGASNQPSDGLDLAVEGIGADGALTLYQSTFEEDAATDQLADVFVGTTDGAVRIANSTLRGPACASIEDAFDDSTVTVTDTIAVDDAGSGAFTSGGGLPWTLTYTITNATANPGIVAGAGTLLATDPKLGPLQDNGGPTLTRLPLTGSPAIDAGDPAFVADPTLPGDQRDLARPSGQRVDIGATEVQQTTTAATLPPTGVDVSTTAWIAATASASGLLLLGAVVLWRRSRRV